MVKPMMYQAKKMLKKMDIDSELIDVRALWDSSLTKRESFGIIKEEAKKLKPSTDYEQFEPERYKTRMVKIGKRQIGKSNIKLDKKRKALPCGLRETWWGTRYYESRKNRCDKKGSV